MKPNPVLKKLGLSETDRVAIIHTDDIGMCQASVDAFADLWDFGLISSGAVMIPCSWYLHAANFAKEHPGTDFGVHLTLTSEWKTYRWGPISTRDPHSGLVDEEGYFYHLTAQAQEHGQTDSVQNEIEAQVSRAQSAGIQITHIDTHMGSVAHPKFMQGYIKLATSLHLPFLMLRLDEAGWSKLGIQGPAAKIAAGLVNQLEEQGYPLLDSMGTLPLDKPNDRLEQARQAFSALQPGVTHFLIHPSKDTPELRAITPDWRARVADYDTFLKKELKDYIQSIGIHVIGYQTLKNLIQ